MHVWCPGAWRRAGVSWESWALMSLINNSGGCAMSNVDWSSLIGLMQQSSLCACMYPCFCFSLSFSRVWPAFFSISLESAKKWEKGGLIRVSHWWLPVSPVYECYHCLVIGAECSDYYCIIFIIAALIIETFNYELKKYFFFGKLTHFFL